jgi:glycosyltransferase involved in cell wall biosynthesis
MHILFLTIVDFSTIEERGTYTDLIREFVRNSHKVYIISPTERKKKESTRLIDDGSVKILKLLIGNLQKTNSIEKGISTLALESIIVSGIKQYFSDVKFDLVMYSTPPITFQRAVEFVKKRDNAKSYLLLKDIFPQNAIDLGILKKTGIKGLIYKHFRKKEERLYKTADYIGCMSEANRKYVLENNAYISPESIEVCPNVIGPIGIEVSDTVKKDVRRKYGVPEDKTVFVYGGNLGKPQGIDFLIKCINSNEYNKNSFFLIVGSGTEFNKLERYFDDEKPKNAKLLDQLSQNDYEFLVNSCDVGMIFLDNRFTIPNFPSRLLSYMQASIPVIAATDVNTDLGETIEKGEFGFWCQSIDVEKFNNLVKKLCDSELRKHLGMNARKFLENNYTPKHSYEIIMKYFA